MIQWRKGRPAVDLSQQHSRGHTLATEDISGIHLQKRQTHFSFFTRNAVSQQEVDQRRDIGCLRLLIPQRIKHHHSQLVPRWDSWVRDHILHALGKVSAKKLPAQSLVVPTLKSAPELVAKPCSTSPTSSNLSRPTNLLNSPTRATCLLTLPPSFLNSGYSSTKRFMSAIEFMDEGD